MPRPSSAVFERLLRRVDLPARPTAPVHEAFTGDVVAQVPVGTASDVVDAFARARRAQAAWAGRPAPDRARVLRRFAALVHGHRRELLDLVQCETGKNRTSALDDVLDVLLNARYLAANGPRLLAPRRVQAMVPGLVRAREVGVPLGVVGVISPWNYPLALAMSDGLAALMVGNAVVLKPASQTPFSALAGAELLDRAGLPRDLWQVVPGAGAEVGTAIVDHCDYLMFTGSSATGARLAARAGERLVGVSAELGGKNAMIVGAGADLARVAEIGVRACFASAGQLCLSSERIYVEASAYDEFCRVFADRIGRMRLGPGYDWMPEMGCLVSADQLATVERHVADAVARGARVLAGGRRRPDLGPTFYEPTLLADVPPGAECHGEETFGPVASVYPVADLDEAVARANDSRYGLAATVFCATDAEGEAVAARLRAGSIGVNEGYQVAWSSLGGPAGGMGASGLGYRHGAEGLLKYTHRRTVATMSRRVHLGGPAGLSPRRWGDLLARGTNALRLLPRR